MAMEHRWGPRRPTNLPVRVVAHSGAIGAGRVLNFSFTGAYLQTNLALQLSSVVYLEPPVPDGGTARPRRFAAGVVRQDDRGVGLEWCDVNTEVAAFFLAGVKTSGTSWETTEFRRFANS